MIWMWTSCAGNEPWAMEKNNGYTYAAPLKVWASIIIHLWIFCGCTFFFIIPAPKTWQFLSEALGKLPSRFLAPLQIFFFRCHFAVMPRAETIWNDLRCKAKVFVLLPAWRSNAIWANAACVGHPQNLEALRASGADVKARAKATKNLTHFVPKKGSVDLLCQSICQSIYKTGAACILQLPSEAFARRRFRSCSLVYNEFSWHISNSWFVNSTVQPKELTESGRTVERMLWFCLF